MARKWACRGIKCSRSCAESASCFFAPNKSKLLRWTPNSSLHMYLTFWSQLKNKNKTGPSCKLNALIRELKVRLVFSHRTCPNRPGGLQTQGCACVLCFCPRQKRHKNGPVGALNALVRAPKVRLVFSHRKSPSHSGGLQTQVCACMLWFGHRKKMTRKWTCRCIKCTGSCAESVSFSHQTCLTHRPGGLQTQVYACVLCFGHRKKRHENGPVGALNALVCAPKVRLIFFEPNMSKPPRWTPN